MTNRREGLENKTFLIVEDDPISAEFLKEVFEEKNVTLIFSKSGEEAIDIVEKNTNISLILMDIRLPGQDGHETVKIIKKINNEVQIIAQTAYAMKEDYDKAIRSGCDDYISKPIRPSVLLEKVKTLLG
ncbi:MAG: response regulator [Bacteroidota bacterium]